MNLIPSRAWRAGFLPGVPLARLAGCLLFCSLTLKVAGAAAADSGLLQRASSGDLKAEMALAHDYQEGVNGFPRDLRQAAAWYRKAADAGDASAEANMGDLYFNGRDGLPKDWSKAFEYYKRAADQGNAWAQFCEGYLYASTVPGVPKDLTKTAELYQLAAAKGIAAAQADLGDYYFNGWGGLPKDTGKALQYYERAAKQGNAWAEFREGFMYQVGAPGVPKDLAKTVALYRAAAKQGQATAMANLGILYAQGLGVPKDLRRAAELYRKAADQGDPWGEYDIGLCYSEGACDQQQDFGQAYTWIRKAAEQNLPEAQCAMAVIYLAGRGVPADRQVARSWFDRAGGEKGCAGYNANIWSPPAATSAVKAADDTARFFGTWTADFSVNGQTVTMVSVHNANGFNNSWRSAQGDTPAGSGGFSAAGGKYKTTAPWPNGSGTYHFTDDDTVVCTNAAGQTVTWHRQKAAE